MGKFEIYKDQAGKHRWRLKAANNEVIAVSEAYESKVGAERGIDAVRCVARDATVVDLSSGS